MEGLDILEYTGEGYDPTMHFGEWRVALTNFAPRFAMPLTRIERHMETDEVFVLLTGSATLIIGTELNRVEMEPGKLYNVRQGTWHHINLKPDSKVLIVENHNTTAENSEYMNV